MTRHVTTSDDGADPSSPIQPDVCSTDAAAFAAFGLRDGTDLVHRTRYRLVEQGHETYRGTATLDALERAFRDAFVHATDSPVVPPAVDAAVDDARHALDGGFDGDADLRHAVLPRFYRAVASFYCSYR